MYEMGGGAHKMVLNIVLNKLTGFTLGLPARKRARPPISSRFTCTSSHLVYCIWCSRCGMLYIGETVRSSRTMFGEHRRAIIGNDANQPVTRHSNSGNHGVSDMKIRALSPISGSNDSRKNIKCIPFPNLALLPLSRHWQSYLFHTCFVYFFVCVVVFCIFVLIYSVMFCLHFILTKSIWLAYYLSRERFYIQ
jgi:hypothetical protein